MTTPERLKRRQLVEGAALIAIGVLMLAQAWYFNAEDRGQRECLERNFVALSEALEVRSDLTTRETEAARRVNLAEIRAASEREFVGELRAYEAEIDAIERERRENPVPPYPPGTCG